MNNFNDLISILASGSFGIQNVTKKMIDELEKAQSFKIKQTSYTSIIRALRNYTEKLGN